MAQTLSIKDHDSTTSTSKQQVELHNKYERSRSHNEYKYTTSMITQQVQKVTIISALEMMEKVWQKM